MCSLQSLSQYGSGFQIKVISSLLTYKEFLLNIHDVLSDEYFEIQSHKWIIKEDIPSLDIVEFMKYYEEDGLGRMIKNTEYWLTNTFSLLNSFKNK